MGSGLGCGSVLLRSMPGRFAATSESPSASLSASLESGDFGEAIPVESGIPQRDFCGLCPFHEEADIDFVRHPDPSVHLETFPADATGCIRRSGFGGADQPCSEGSILIDCSERLKDD